MALKCTITPVLLDSMPRMAIINETVYEGSPMRNSISSFQTSSPEEQAKHLAWSTHMLRKRFETNTSSLAFQAVNDANGDVVGWTDWKRPAFEGPRIPSKTVNASENTEEPPMTTCLRMDQVSKFNEMWEAARIRTMGNRNDYWSRPCLAGIMVDKQYQRRGVGQALLNAGLAAVDLAGQEVYCAATPALAPLLKKNGFAEVETISTAGIDSQLVVMVRKGQKTQAP